MERKSAVSDFTNSLVTLIRNIRECIERYYSLRCRQILYPSRQAFSPLAFSDTNWPKSKVSNMTQSMEITMNHLLEGIMVQL